MLLGSKMRMDLSDMLNNPLAVRAVAIGPSRQARDGGYRRSATVGYIQSGTCQRLGSVNGRSHKQHASLLDAAGGVASRVCSEGHRVGVVVAQLIRFYVRFRLDSAEEHEAGGELTPSRPDAAVATIVYLPSIDDNRRRPSWQDHRGLGDPDITGLVGQKSPSLEHFLNGTRAPAASLEDHSGISFRIHAVTEVWRGVQPNSSRARLARTRLLQPKVK
jgi:hypothetical protein